MFDLVVGIQVHYRSVILGVYNIQRGSSSFFIHSFVLDLNHSDQRNNFCPQKVKYSWLQECVVSLVTLGGGLLVVLIGCTCVNTIFGAWGGFGGVRYQIGKSNINIRRLRVVITCVLNTPEGGNKNIIC